MKTELGEGLRYVFTHRLQRGIVGAVAISNFFGQLVFSILLVFAVRELDLSAGTIGLVLTVGNVGTLASALTARRIGERLGVGRTILLAAFLFAPGMLLIALAPASLAIPLITLGMVIVGFGGILFNVTMISLIQVITPDRLLGRVNSVYRFFGWGMIPIGALIGGLLVSVLDGPLSREWALRVPWVVAGVAELVLAAVVARSLTSSRIDAVRAGGKADEQDGTAIGAVSR
jgi:MFS family permease